MSIYLHGHELFDLWYLWQLGSTGTPVARQAELWDQNFTIGLESDVETSETETAETTVSLD